MAKTACAIQELCEEILRLCEYLNKKKKKTTIICRNTRGNLWGRRHNCPIIAPTCMHVHLLPYHTPATKVSVLTRFNGTQQFRAKVIATQLGLYTICQTHTCFPMTTASLSLHFCIWLEWQAAGPNQWLKNCLRVLVLSSSVHPGCSENVLWHQKESKAWEIYPSIERAHHNRHIQTWV